MRISDWSSDVCSSDLAALDHALANMLESHALAAYLEQYAGGLKGLVRDMRQARRKEKPAAASRTDAARKKLRSKVALKPEEVPTDEHGFDIMVGRREADGSLSIVGAVGGAPVMAERDIRNARMSTRLKSCPSCAH